MIRKIWGHGTVCFFVPVLMPLVTQYFLNQLPAGPAYQGMSVFQIKGASKVQRKADC